MSTRLPGTNLPHPPPATTWHPDHRRPYTLLTAITLITGALALLVAALGS
ncbi:hypothetical protein [Micromonospora coxensis]